MKDRCITFTYDSNRNLISVKTVESEIASFSYAAGPVKSRPHRAPRTLNKPDKTKRSKRNSQKS